MILLAMFNNFFHDLTSALWFSTALILWFLSKKAEAQGNDGLHLFYREVFPSLFRISLISIILNLIFGVVRALTYMEVEYLPAAGKGQLTALIIKHVLIFSVVLIGLVLEVKLFKKYQQMSRR